MFLWMLCAVVMWRAGLLLIESALEADSDADAGVFENASAFDAYDFSTLYTSETAFFLGQCGASGEIDLHDISGSDRCCHRQRDENACFTDICTASIEESVSLWKPHTYGP